MPIAEQHWDADDYAHHSSAQWQWAMELIAKLALRGDESILDIGCGDGKVSARLAQIVSSGIVVGIDAAATMINRSVQQFPPERYPNLYFACMDAASIRLAKRFDWAFSNAALHWVADHVAVLTGTHASLKSGGKILFQMGGRGNAHEIFRIVRGITGLPRWCQYFDDFIPPYHFYGPEDYEQWLAQCDFLPRRIELIPKDMQHRGRPGLIGWLRSTWFPYTDRLPAQQRDLFLEEVVENYLSLYPLDADGNTHVEMVRLEVEAYALS
jgi:trans-aconitate 2-methyltransferase